MWHRVAPALAAGHTVLAMWSTRDELPTWFDVLGTWRCWADDVRGRGIDAGHVLAEEAPDEVAPELLSFLEEP